MTLTVPRSPQEPLFIVQAYQPSDEKESRHWQAIRNNERYDAWRRKRNRITRDAMRQINIRPGWGVLRASRLSTEAALVRAVIRYLERAA